MSTGAAPPARHREPRQPYVALMTKRDRSCEVWLTPIDSALGDWRMPMGGYEALV
jgi:hypothetical protein